MSKRVRGWKQRLGRAKAAVKRGEYLRAARLLYPKSSQTDNERCAAALKRTKILG